MTGNRLLLSRELSQRILKEKLEPECWSFADWWRARRAKSDNLAVIQDGHTVAKALGFVHVMGGEQNGAAGLFKFLD